MSAFFEILDLHIKPHRHFLGHAEVLWPGRGPRPVNIFCVDNTLFFAPGEYAEITRFAAAELESAFQVVLKEQLCRHSPDLLDRVAREASR